MTLNQASKGFKNQGQFIAALHVSQNLGIPFADLKTAMTGIRPVTTTGGTTGSTGTTSSGSTSGTIGTTSDSTSKLSLGQAIQKLRPGADADSASELAEHQATRDVQTTTTSTSSSSTTSSSTSSTSTTTSSTSTKRHGK